MSEHQTLQVALGARAYDIVVGQGLIARAPEYCARVMPSRRAVIVTDETVGGLYAMSLVGALEKARIRADVLTIRPGEGSKNMATFAWLMEALLALKPDRKTSIIALGGGVVGDLAGFAASVLLRGVPLIQIPTTLLAQVDSSVGGKTAINATQGKNLIGSFYQPLLVLADSDVLKTLPEREVQAGYAEVIKYGLIADAPFYRWCMDEGAKVIRREGEALREAVLKSCAHKAAIVQADEREADQRALLNFGHTFAHALEAETGFGETLLHGEAVAMGMIMACRMSHRMGLVVPEVEVDLARHLRSMGLRTHLRDVKGIAWNIDRIMSHFADDKKAENGNLTFVVLESIGKARVEKSVDPAFVRAVVASYF